MSTLELAIWTPCLGKLILLFVPSVAVTEEILSNRLNWEEVGTFYGLISRCRNCGSNYNALKFSITKPGIPQLTVK